MSKKQPTKKVEKKALEGSKRTKMPKFKLISYTMKAVIPTGQYANIQPELTVEAESIEQAERAVMPYIESLFARYREAGVLPIQAPLRPVATPQNTPVAPKPVAPVVPVAPVAKAPVTPAPAPVVAPAPVAPAAIVMTVPFSRAKQALESCTSLAALKLVSDQVEKSTKLVEAEKVELRKLSADKLAQLNVKP